MSNNTKLNYLIISIIEALGISLIIIHILFHNWNDTIIFGVLGDEFGYWGNAASLIGFDWESLMSESAYYGMGYSIIISPLLFISNYALRYHCAIIINIFLLIFSLLCSLYIYSALSPQSTHNERIAKAAVSIFTINAISQARISWPETLISFLMWCLIALMINMSQHITVWKLSTFIIVNVYMVMVHQRTLPIVLLSIGFEAYILYKSRKRKYIVILVILFTLLFFIYNYSKGVQVAKIYMNSETSNINNYNVSVGLFSTYYKRVIENFITILASLFSKVLVTIISTYFLVIVTITKIISKIQKKEFNDFFYIQVFVLLSCIIMVFLTSVQIYGKGRSDLIVYSRYYDYLIGPIILLGFIDLDQHNKVSSSLSHAVAIIMIIFEIFIVDYMVDSNISFNYICSPLPGSLLLLASEHGNIWSSFNALFCKYTLMLFLIYITLIRFSKKKILNIFYVFILIMNIALADKVSNAVNVWRATMSEKAYTIQNKTNNSNLLYLAGTTEDFGIACALKDYQFMNATKSIQRIEQDDITDVSFSNCYLITDKKLEVKTVSENIADNYYLYQLKKNN